MWMPDRKEWNKWEGESSKILWMYMKDWTLSFCKGERETKIVLWFKLIFSCLWISIVIDNICTYMWSESCVCAQLCLTLLWPLWTGTPPGSSVHGIFQARILEWVAISYSRDFPDLGLEPTSLASPALAGGFFTTAQPGKPNNHSTYGCNNCRRKQILLRFQFSLLFTSVTVTRYGVSTGKFPSSL